MLLIQSRCNRLAAIAILLSPYLLCTGSAQTSVSDAASGGSPQSSVAKGVSVTTAKDAATPVAPSPPDSGTGVASDRNMRIGGGDQLEMTLFGIADFHPIVRVSESGDISVPPLSTLHVAGLTTNQAEDLVRSELIKGGFYKDPRVSVLIKEYATQGASILGEVTKPGVYPVLGSRKLLDMISAAGGLTPKAGTRGTITRRSQPDTPIKISLTRDSAQMQGSNVEILPGDTVMIEPAGIAYVVGDVAKPSGFLIDNERLTVLQALSLAGGANATANLGQSRIIRQKSGEQTAVALDKILQGVGTDIALHDGDILFVPLSKGKSAAMKSVNAIVQAATGIAIYSTRRY